MRPAAPTRYWPGRRVQGSNRVQAKTLH